MNVRSLLVFTFLLILLTGSKASQFEGSDMIRQLTVNDGKELFSGQGMSVVLFYGRESELQAIMKERIETYKRLGL